MCNLFPHGAQNVSLFFLIADFGIFLLNREPGIPSGCKFQ